MKNMFSYDSKLMSVLGFLADMFICNVLFLLCCIPVITIGPAQSALHSAMRVLADPEDDRSCAKTFFKSFISGFGKISIGWLLVFIFDLILFYTLLMTYSYAEYQLFVHWALPLVVLVICLTYHSVMTVFHSQFGCTFPQLLKNTFLVMIIHPIRSLATGVLTWAPIAFAIMMPELFVRSTPLFLAVYYSIAFMLISLLMKKPFQKLIDHFNGDDIEIKNEPEEKEEDSAPEGPRLPLQ